MQYPAEQEAEKRKAKVAKAAQAKGLLLPQLVSPAQAEEAYQATLILSRAVICSLFWGYY